MRARIGPSLSPVATKGFMARVVFDPSVYFPNNAPKCPVCLANADIYRPLKAPELLVGWCEVCGDMNITRQAADHARSSGKGYLLSAALKRRPADQEDRTITLEDVDRILKDAPVFTVLEKLDIALATVAHMSDRPGALSRFSHQKDYPLASAASPDEAFYYLRELEVKGYLRLENVTAVVTMPGYERLDQINKMGRQSVFAFVAMWFDPSRNSIYDDAIAPAIVDAGYQPLRIDKFEHVNRIDDEIIGQIKRSRFMVADFTGQRAGVYFEAGLMLGLTRNVIWMCDRKELHDVHFDTRQYNFIDYESTADAKARLFYRILAIEGEGPRRLVGLKPT